MGNQDGVQGPSLGAILASHGDRLDVLERSAAAGGVPAFEDLSNAGGKTAPDDGTSWVFNAQYSRWEPRGPRIPFSCSGALTVSTSPPYPLPYPYLFTITEARFALGTAGSSDTVIGVYVNGSHQFDVTLGAGTTQDFTDGLRIACPVVATISVAVTTVGTGAKDLGGWVQMS